jgi:adenylosuccinate synthase
MTTLTIVGAQWGDEGKGKVVDILASHADVVVRYGGGANAGHTLVVGTEKVVFHLVPSGALHPRPRLVLGPGMAIDPKVLVKELSVLEQRGLLTEGRVLISDRAHLVLSYHAAIDALRERGPGAIGTTKRGIGPCYEDRAARRGLRAGDLSNVAGFREKVAAALEAWRPTIEALGGEPPNTVQVADEYLKIGETLLPFIGDSLGPIHDARDAGQRVLLEGAQGTMLDVDHGTYPFVTSSSTAAGGACIGTGLAPSHIDRVIGISKAYTTRVGSGPFPTEMHGPEGDALREAGGEYGATTGRPRRCGWLDVPVLKHAVRVNGLSELALTKIDVLTGRDPVCICVAYEIDGRRVARPSEGDIARARPLYEEMPGWRADLTGCRSMSELPEEARSYLRRIEELVGVPVSMLSLGPERTQTIQIQDPWR